MENQIQQFTNQLFGSVRSILDQYGNPWFVATDIAKILGYSDASHMTRILEDSDKGLHIVETLGGAQKLSIINESGLYNAIFSSRLPAAVEFKHWVTSEVLPTMRKVGFNRSIQVLQEENMRLKSILESHEQSNMFNSIDRIEVSEMRVQMIDKIKSIPDGTPLTPEVKQFILKYDENWEG